MITKNENLKKMVDELDVISTKLKELKGNEFVIEYLKAVSDKERVKREIQGVTAKIQMDCKHNIWYHMRTETDEFEGRSYHKCMCIKCGAIRENRVGNFKNLIKTSCTFDEVQRKYFEVMKLTDNIDATFIILKDIFTGKV